MPVEVENVNVIHVHGLSVQVTTSCGACSDFMYTCEKCGYNVYRCIVSMIVVRRS